MRFVGLRLKPFLHPQNYLGLLFSVCTLALVAGCEQAGRPRDTGGLQPRTEKVNDDKVTVAEAEKFAKQYLSAIDRQDTKKIVELVHWDAIVDRSFKGLPTNNDFYKEYSTGAKSILGNFSKGIQSETAVGGSYALLKTVRRGKDRHAIFRLVTGASAPAGGGSINYHNLRLIKLDGKVRADDIYIARAASWLSESYRNAIRPVLLKKERPVGGFTAKHIKELEDNQLITDMVKAARSGNAAEASRIYQQLPEDVRNEKTVLTTRLLVTERDDFLEAVEAMLSKYPDSPAVGLRLIDFGNQQEDLPMIKRARELLEKWTGGDSYIDLNVAFVMLKSGKVDEAAELNRAVAVGDFDFINPIFLKYKIALAAKDNKTLLTCFRALRDDFDEDIKKILKSDECSDFVESLEYVDLKND